MKLFKKILLTALLLKVLTCAYAGAPEVLPKSFSGFYVGAQVGYAEGYLKDNLLLNWSDTGLFSGVQFFRRDFERINITGVGGIKFGYGFQRDEFYLGAEIHAMYENLKVKSGRSGLSLVSGIPGVTGQISDSRVNATIQNDVGFGLRPGLIIAPNVLLAARFGIVVSRLKLDSSTRLESPFGGGITVTTAASQKRNIAAPGFRMGLGLQALLSLHWSWSVEYLFTDYGDYQISEHALSPGQTQVGTVNKVAIKTRGLMVGISYLFNGANNYVAPMNNYNYDLFNGLYFGLHFGFIQSYFRIRPDIKAVLPATPLIGNGALGSEASSSNLVGGLYTGYGHNIGRFYLGAELFGTLENTAGRSEFTSTELTGAQKITNIMNTSLENEYGIGIKPGVLLTSNVLLYGLIGVTRARFKINSFMDDTTAGVTSRADVTASKNVTGVRVGIGMATQIAHNLSFNINYFYTNYQPLSIGSMISFGAGGGSIFVNNTRVSPRMETLLVGLSYYIN